jgi:hypothetical protein
VRVDAAADLLASLASPAARWLAPADVARLCADWGIALAARRDDAGEGAEVVVGVTLDASFGPVLAVGPPDAGEGELAVRLTPVTHREAAEAVAGVRGVRGRDAAALADLVVRVAALADAHPEVVQIELDPVVVRDRGAVAAAARAQVATAAPEPMWPAVGVAPPRR